MGPDQMTALREHLQYVLRGGGALLDFDHAVAELPAGLRDVRPARSAMQPLAAA